MRRSEIYIFGFRGFPGVQGGIEAHAEHLAPRLVKLGYNVTACMRSPYIDSKCARKWEGVTLLRLWTVRNTHIETLLHSLICALVAGIRRPQVVHVHGIGPALVTPLLRVLGLRVVVTHHGEDYNREKWGWAARTVLRAGEILGMCFAHKRIAVSRGIEKLVRTKYNRPCEVIPNGVEITDLPLQTDKVTAMGLVPGRYVLTVGRIVPEKRQLDLLHAFRNAKLDGWKLAIVGRVDHANSYAERLASEARLMGNVIMAGYQSGETLRQLYAHAGVFALPSSHEGFPIALLEARSYGLPVLVSDITSNREIVSDPAQVFNVGDIDDLTAKLAAFSNCRVEATEREALRRDSAGQYDWSNIALKTAATYRELAGPEIQWLR
jgi:glycosyltransferase involved in cell wall biosynthesis